MSRLPTPGGDNDVWGDLLNDFLGVEHNADGSLKNVARPADLVPKLNKAGDTMTGPLNLAADPSTNLQAATKHYVDSISFAGAPDATTSSKGIIQLTGDLAGTAAAPTVPGLAGKEAAVTAGTSAQYYRGDKTWQTLNKGAVGLGNVDNTSDTNKPVSNATQTALNTKLTASNNLSDLSNTGTARTNLGLGTASTNNTGDFDPAGAASTAQTNAEAYTDSKFPVPASSVTYNNTSSGLTATDVQAAIDELKTDVDSAGGGTPFMFRADAVEETGTVFTGSPPSGLLAFDGDSNPIADGQIVLLTNQSSAVDNGLWTAHAGNWTRPSNWSNGTLLKDGTTVVVGYEYGFRNWEALYILEGDELVGTDNFFFDNIANDNALWIEPDSDGQTPVLNVSSLQWHGPQSDPSIANRVYADSATGALRLSGLGTWPPAGGPPAGIGTKLVYQTFTHVPASGSTAFGNLSWVDPGEKLHDDGSGDVTYDSLHPGNFRVNTPGIYSVQIYIDVNNLTNQNALIEVDYNFAGQGWGIREGYGNAQPATGATFAECTAILPPTYFDVTNKNSFACEYFVRDSAASWYIEESTVIITRIA